MKKKLKKEVKHDYNTPNIELNQALELLQKELDVFGGDIVEEILKRKSDFALKDGTDFYKGYIIDIYICPDCESAVGDEIVAFNFCPKCGKKLMK